MIELWLVLVGFAAGIISGMGIGGGAILIPALTIIFRMTQQNAQMVNLLYFIPTALLAVCIHKKSGNLEKRNLPENEKNRLLPLILWGLFGALPGALIAVKIEAAYLRKGFAVFLLIVGLYEMRKGFLTWKANKT